MKCPIVIAAFGSTTRARSAYARIDEQLQKRFAGHEIFWGYNSRIVRSRLRQQSVELPTPREVLDRIGGQGHKWAVVQSLNMICGHEFHRMKDEVLKHAVRVSIGHSLLCSPGDFLKAADAMAPFFERDRREAVVFVGHGTDHCAWSVYPAFELLLRQRHGGRAFVGVIEEGWPRLETVIENVRSAGLDRVRLVPLLLVAGMHFEKDLAGPGDSWKSAFEARGIRVSLELAGLAANPRIIEIFGDHMESAMDVIPARKMV